jgi:hypothetical protein
MANGPLMGQDSGSPSEAHTGRHNDQAQQTAAADALQRPLVPRSRFQARLSGGVRLAEW